VQFTVRVGRALYFCCFSVAFVVQLVTSYNIASYMCSCDGMSGSSLYDKTN